MRSSSPEEAVVVVVIAAVRGPLVHNLMTKLLLRQV
jgi:hypothetical protein